MILISNQHGFLSILGVTCALGAVIIAQAEEIPTTPVSMEDLRKQLDEQSRQITAQQRALEEEMRKLESHKRALQETRHQVESMKARLEGRPVPQASTAAVAQAESGTPQHVGQAPDPSKDSRVQEIARIFEQPGVLTPRGKFVFEPSLAYSYSSNNRVALVGYTIIPAITIGLIDIRNVDRNTLIGAVTGRYGITNRFEVEAKLPYVYRSDTTLTRAVNVGSVTDSAFSASGKAIGDVEFAARYQLNEGGGNQPYYIGGLRVKTHTGKDPFEVEIDANNLATTLPTGSGFYGIQPSLTAIYPSDPAVFFGSVSYLWNIKRDINRTVGTTYVGTVDPGDALGFNFGMGLALNEKASFSLGYDHSIVGKDKLDGNILSTSQTRQLGSLLIGYAYRLNPTTSLNLSLGVGVTSEAPNVQLTLRMPVTF